MPGKYGPYVKWEKVNATLPKTMAAEDIDKEINVLRKKIEGGADFAAFFRTDRDVLQVRLR